MIVDSVKNTSSFQREGGGNSADVLRSISKKKELFGPLLFQVHQVVVKGNTKTSSLCEQL